jgi:hypothetical protein
MISPGPSASEQPRPGLEFAATRWIDFPVGANPRALVLTSPPFGLGTVVSPVVSEALQSGGIAVDDSVPAEAVNAIRMAGLLRGSREDPSVRFVSAIPSAMGFGTDRGGRQLGAWLLSIGGVDGSCYVMDAASQSLAYPPNGEVTSSHRLGGYAKLLGDGLTVRVDFGPPWLTRDAGVASSAVDVLETDTAVVFAPTVDHETTVPGDAGQHGVPAMPAGVTFRLRQPLGARVLCDVGGSPVVVARRKRNGR